VNREYIDSTNKTVIPKKLKLRSGPGEEYSVLGMAKKGDSIKETSSKGDWLQIEAPADAYAFVAAVYLKQEVPELKPVEPPPVAANVAEAPPVAPATTTAPPPPVTDAPIVAAPPTAPVTEGPPPKRIVEREGIVRGTISIQAPSSFGLVNPDTGRTIDYLYTTSKDLDLRRYKGLRVVVAGEEAIDDRWPNTPVITIQRIQVAD
jgi:uncharacterized protein YgiM (DUF1202 family)